MPPEDARILDRRTLWVCLLLLAAVAAVYTQTADHEFLLLDDDQYVYDNGHVRRGLSLEGLRWAWTTHHAANWHPLTWLSHQLDVALFGLDPAGHHLMNAALHALNAMLLFAALRWMTGAAAPSAFVALLFALHPLRVESVAWASERKDVLSGMFWMLTLLAYAWYARRPALMRYLAVAASLALGLMAKPMGVTLPFVLLLLDVWPLGRWPASRPRRLLVEKLPLLALAAVSSIVTVVAQQAGRAVSAFEGVPFGLRAANAAVAYVAYLWKTVWPVGLAALYPHPALGAELPPYFHATAAAAALGIAALTYLALRAGRDRPYLAVGWLWFLGTLVPVIGLFQVGLQSMADRYAYLPLVGIYIATVWALSDLKASRPALGPALKVAGALVLVLLALAAWRQAGTWRTSRSVFEQAIRTTRANYVAHTYLGTVFNVEGDLAAAVREYERALAVEPGHADAHNALGVVFGKRGDMARAASHLEQALTASPDHPDAHYNLGLVRETQGQPEQAAARFAEAIRLRPGFVRAHYGLGSLRQRQGRKAEAVSCYERVLELDPAHGAARDALEGLSGE